MACTACCSGGDGLARSYCAILNISARNRTSNAAIASTPSASAPPNDVPFKTEDDSAALWVCSERVSARRAERVGGVVVVVVVVVLGTVRGVVLSCHHWASVMVLVVVVVVVGF